MNKILALLLLLPSLCLADSLIARDSTGNIITITDAPCQHEWLKDWKAAEFLYQGKVYKACWTVKGDRVVILDSGGDISAVPIGMFGKENKT